MLSLVNVAEIDSEQAGMVSYPGCFPYNVISYDVLLKFSFSFETGKRAFVEV